MNPYEIRRANLRARLRQVECIECGAVQTYRVCAKCYDPAPPLSPAEQVTVDRFESAPDPWGDE